MQEIKDARIVTWIAGLASLPLGSRRPGRRLRPRRRRGGRGRRREEERARGVAGDVPAMGAGSSGLVVGRKIREHHDHRALSVSWCSLAQQSGLQFLSLSLYLSLTPCAWSQLNASCCVRAKCDYI